MGFCFSYQSTVCPVSLPFPFYLLSLLFLSLGSSFFLLCEKPSRNRYFETFTHALKTHACHSNPLQCLPPQPCQTPLPNQWLSFIGEVGGKEKEVLIESYMRRQNSGNVWLLLACVLCWTGLPDTRCYIKVEDPLFLYSCFFLLLFCFLCSVQRLVLIDLGGIAGSLPLSVSLPLSPARVYEHVALGSHGFLN